MVVTVVVVVVAGDVNVPPNPLGVNVPPTLPPVTITPDPPLAVEPVVVGVVVVMGAVPGVGAAPVTITRGVVGAAPPSGALPEKEPPNGVVVGLPARAELSGLCARSGV